MSKLNPDFLADSIVDDESLDVLSGGNSGCMPPVICTATVPTISNMQSDDNKVVIADYVPGGCYGSGY